MITAVPSSMSNMQLEVLEHVLELLEVKDGSMQERDPASSANATLGVRGHPNLLRWSRGLPQTSVTSWICLSYFLIRTFLRTPILCDETRVAS